MLKKTLVIFILLLASYGYLGAEELKIEEKKMEIVEKSLDSQNILYIESVEIKGIKEIPTEILEEVMILKKGKVFSAELMVKDYINLKKMIYITDAKIYPKIEKGKIKLVIELVEKENAKALLKERNIVPLSEREKIDKSLIIKSIEIEGNNYISKEEIQKQILINIGSYLSKEKIVESKNNIMKMGYFKDVRPDVLKYKSGIYVKYTVLENPVLNSIKILGNTLVDEELLINEMETKAGQIYNVNTLRKDTENIRKIYGEKGYVMADVYDIRLSQDYNLEIQISEGILRGIEYVKIEKNDNTSDGSRNGTELKTKKFVLDREIEMKVGEVFEVNSYQKTLKNVFRTSNFKDVKPTFKRIPEDPDGLILVLNLDENKSAALQGAISYGDNDTGLVGSFSLNDTNFLGRAQTLGVSAEISSKEKKSYSLSFSDPWIKGTNKVSFSTSLYRKDYVYQNTGNDDYELITGFKLSLGKQLIKNVRLTLSGRIEKIIEGIIPEDIVDSEGKTIKGEREKELEYNDISFSPSLRYDTRNHRFDTTEGEYAELTLTPGYQYNGEGADYKEGFYSALKLELRKFHNFIFKKNTLAYRAVVAGVTDTAIRSNSYYKVGGMYNLRGFNAKDTEGSQQFYANIENRYKIDDTVQFVLFYDIGSAYSDIDDFIVLKDLKKDYGIGLRLNTPLGPLRFDMAWPLNEENKKGKFLFSIGQLF